MTSAAMPEKTRIWLEIKTAVPEINKSGLLTIMCWQNGDDDDNDDGVDDDDDNDDGFDDDDDNDDGFDDSDDNALMYCAGQGWMEWRSYSGAREDGFQRWHCIHLMGESAK